MGDTFKAFNTTAWKKRSVLTATDEKICLQDASEMK